MTPDQMNATLELAWTLVVFASARRAFIDGELKGVSLWHVALTLLTSWWFIFYYWHLHQWWSVASSLTYALATGSWVVALTMVWWRKRGG